MNAAHRSLVALLLAVALSGCGAKESETAQPMPVEDTVFGDTVGAMDKARAVEAQTMQHKEELDRAMENAEGAQ